MPRVQVGWINANPCLKLKKLKEAPGRDRILSEEEIDKLLQSCCESRSPYLYSIVLIALTTGSRLGEILSLEWNHVDFDNRLALLKTTKNGDHAVFLYQRLYWLNYATCTRTEIQPNHWFLQVRPHLEVWISKRLGSKR